jgi:hypothetical protein
MQDVVSPAVKYRYCDPKRKEQGDLLMETFLFKKKFTQEKR